MSTFARVLIDNLPKVEEYEDPETGKKKRRKLAPADSCPHCGDDVMVPVEGEVIVGGVIYTRSAPCKWCERGAALAIRLARGRRGEKRIDVSTSYADDAVFDPTRQVEPETDEELAWQWLEAGWKRDQDGLLRSIHTGEASLQPPEHALPPRPDGTRPPREEQRSEYQAKRELQQRVRDHLGEIRARRQPLALRIEPREGEATILVIGRFGALHEAVVRYAELAAPSPSRTELGRVCEVAHQDFDAVLAALREAARDRKPREVAAEAGAG